MLSKLIGKYGNGGSTFECGQPFATAMFISFWDVRDSEEMGGEDFVCDNVVSQDRFANRAILLQGIHVSIPF